MDTNRAMRGVIAMRRAIIHLPAVANLSILLSMCRQAAHAQGSMSASGAFGGGERLLMGKREAGFLSRVDPTEIRPEREPKASVPP